MRAKVEGKNANVEPWTIGKLKTNSINYVNYTAFILLTTVQSYSVKSATVREANNGSGVCKEHYA